MKRLFILILPLLLLFSCKKDTVDGSTIRSFQSTINDMSSTLNTIEQIKFNEALYILKTFGVEAEGDVEELKALSKLLDGKKVPEILAMADSVAKENNVDWSSTAPPSLGDMNIFQDEKASETDPNDVYAKAIQLTTRETAVDSILGPKAIQITPRLVDNSGNKIIFENAGLETTLEVYNQGVKLLTSKNLMQNNRFPGFTLRFASLPREKILDNLIDIKVSVKTSKKTLQYLKKGIPINAKALLMPQGTPEENPYGIETDPTAPQPTPTEPTPATIAKGDPKNTVSSFLNSLATQNLRGAYDLAENPRWGSYESFSNPTSGFGSVKNVAVKNVSTKASGNNTASVGAVYTVTDRQGNLTDLDVSYGLKYTENGWRITSYTINSSQKQ